MLAGIVKPKGEVVDLGEMNDILRASSRRCFEAGFLYGTNEKGAMIRFDSQIKSEIFVKDADQPAAEPEPAAEPGPAAEPEPEQESGQPADPGDRTGAK